MHVFFVCVLMQALKQAFPTGTFLKNGIVQGVKVRTCVCVCDCVCVTVCVNVCVCVCVCVCV